MLNEVTGTAGNSHTKNNHIFWLNPKHKNNLKLLLHPIILLHMLSVQTVKGQRAKGWVCEFTCTWMTVAAWCCAADLDLASWSRRAQRSLAPHFSLYLLHCCWITSAAALLQKTYRQRKTWCPHTFGSSKREIYSQVHIWRAECWPESPSVWKIYHPPKVSSVNEDAVCWNESGVQHHCKSHKGGSDDDKCSLEQN